VWGRDDVVADDPHMQTETDDWWKNHVSTKLNLKRIESMVDGALEDMEP
jgi:hypothetical protein